MSIGGFVAFKKLQLPLVDGTTPLPREREKNIHKTVQDNSTEFTRGG